MAGFKIRAETAGENVLAQRMAFKRGYRWGVGAYIIREDKSGLCLFFYDSSNRMTLTSVHRKEYFDAHENVEVTLSDIAAWPLEK